MEFGEDLTLGMLSDDSSEEFVLGNDNDVSRDLDEKLEGGVQVAPVKEKDINISEGNSPESVAEEDKSKAPEAKPSPGADNDKLSQIYSSIATHFHDAGVLPSLNLEETKIESAEDLQKAIQTEIKSATEENAKAYQEALERGEPENEYLKYTKQKEDLDKITPEVLTNAENTKLRFNIIAQDFLNKNFNREDALKYAKRSQDLAEDIVDAEKALESIKEFNSNSYQASVREKKNKDEASVNEIKRYVTDTKEIIPGIELNELTKDNLLKQMTTAVSKDTKGTPVTEYGKALIDNPVKTKAITEYMFLITKGFTDFSKINNLIASKTTRNLDEVLRNQGGSFLEGNKIVNDNQSTFSINDEFDFDVD